MRRARLQQRRRRRRQTKALISLDKPRGCAQLHVINVMGFLLAPLSQFMLSLARPGPARINIPGPRITFHGDEIQNRQRARASPHLIHWAYLRSQRAALGLAGLQWHCFTWRRFYLAGCCLNNIQPNSIQSDLSAASECCNYLVGSQRRPDLQAPLRFEFI